jgi:hypothetical protein
MNNSKNQNDTDTYNKGFPIISVYRDSLERMGFDAGAVDDATMKELALQMARDYCVQLFWGSLEIIGDHLGIPRRVANE